MRIQRKGEKRLLDLRFGHDVPHALRELLEHHGRAAGCSLVDLELAGQDLATAEAFIVAAEQGLAADFARTIAARPPAAPEPVSA